MGARKFQYFVIFAGMRTGSNFLEANINAFADLHSHGELFNPVFVGGAKKDALFGITMEEREKNPFQMIEAVRALDPSVIPGFRFFHDHDPRILASCLADPECGKIILTRNPLDSYVSRKIAAETGQWKLTNLKHQKTAQVTFDRAEFETYLDEAQAFQVHLLAELQKSGQTAFYINYDDIHSLDVLNGLARFLGSDHRIEGLDKTVKKQNPAAMESKVRNFAEMDTALGKMDLMRLSRTPNFEPRRGAGVPQFLAGVKTPLLYLPIKGAPVGRIAGWLARHEENQGGEVISGMNQKTLKEWRISHTGFQALSVVRHPVARAYHSFCTYIVSTEVGAYRDIRTAIIKNYRVKVPQNGFAAPGYDAAGHKAAFVGFLKFLKANLAQQTSLRIDPAWASQVSILTGAAGVVIPAHVFHEDALEAGLAYVEGLAGLPHLDVPSNDDPAWPVSLADIYDTRIETLVREVYARDYLNFGFADWA